MVHGLPEVKQKKMLILGRLVWEYLISVDKLQLSIHKIYIKNENDGKGSIVSIKGLAPNGDKPFLESMLSKI